MDVRRFGIMGVKNGDGSRALASAQSAEMHHGSDGRPLHPGRRTVPHHAVCREAPRQSCSSPRTPKGASADATGRIFLTDNNQSLTQAADVSARGKLDWNHEVNAIRSSSWPPFKPNHKREGGDIEAKESAHRK